MADVEWTKDLIKEVRERLGETQEEFATHFRVTVYAVRIWEQGQREPGGPATVILDQLLEYVKKRKKRAREAVTV